MILKKAAPYLFVVGLFLLMACGDMLTRGMFMDGLIYSGIAKSMSLGIGSFWHPSYTLTNFMAFYEHPPLMMWLMSLWFRITGPSILAAKLYAAIVTIICAVMIVGVWHRMGGNAQLSWLPLLMCTLIPPVSHFANNNVLEFTMGMFVLASVWFMLGDKRPWLGHLIGGLLLSCAFLTKGFTGLFPLALPVLIWIMGAKPGRTLGNTIWLTILVVAGTVLPIVAMVLLNPDAAEFLQRYLNHQVLGGIHVQTVDSRFYIIGRFFMHTAIILFLLAVVLVLGHISKESSLRIGSVLRGNSMAWALLALALCGVVPIMISTKQRDFYLLTAFPFMALSTAALMQPYVERCCQWLHSRAMVVVAIVVIVLGVAANAYMCGKPGRDNTMIQDMDVILPQLAEGETMTIPAPLAYRYNLQGYYYMNGRVSLDTQNNHRHLLTTAEYPADSCYREVSLTTKEYILYEQIQ
ncbi:MAG: glycosyltransferase family 39 protein [Bacteroidales bacterium]|nr:glycosyltransferase family 39 protein [Bacteroidales bacterium]